MNAVVTKFIEGSRRLGAHPKITQTAVFFDSISLEVRPSVHSPQPSQLELVWPAEEHLYDAYPALFFIAMLGPEARVSDFIKPAIDRLACGCGYSECHGNWAVRMFSRQGNCHLLFVDIENPAIAKHATSLPAAQ